METGASTPITFAQWAIPKLGPLVIARAKDAMLGRGQPLLVNFGRLLSVLMAEFELQPFARPDFVDNLDATGQVCFTTATLRKRAERFFRTNSFTHRAALLARAAPGGIVNVSSANTSDPFIATDLWAIAEHPRVREITCLELGIPATTPAAGLPPNFALKLKEVLLREFSLLTEIDRAAWHALAQERASAMNRGETNFCAVQDMQGSISGCLSRFLLDKVTNNAVGDMVIQWSGFYVGPQNNTVNRFRGQVSTYEPSERWFATSEYIQHVEPLWQRFIDRQVEGQIIDRLTNVPRDASTEHLLEFRDRLKLFLEELFKVSCRLDAIDEVAFWALVESHPHEFVAPERLPHGTQFINPHDMSEGEFRTFYEHVKRCFGTQQCMDPASRFVYRPAIINRYIAISEAYRLKAHLDAKNGVSSNIALAVEPNAVPVLAASQRTVSADALNLPTAGHDSALFPAATSDDVPALASIQDAAPAPPASRGGAAISPAARDASLVLLASGDVAPVFDTTQDTAISLAVTCNAASVLSAAQAPPAAPVLAAPILTAAQDTVRATPAGCDAATVFTESHDASLGFPASCGVASFLAATQGAATVLPTPCNAPLVLPVVPIHPAARAANLALAAAHDVSLVRAASNHDARPREGLDDATRAGETQADVVISSLTAPVVVTANAKPAAVNDTAKMPAAALKDATIDEVVIDVATFVPPNATCNGLEAREKRNHSEPARQAVKVSRQLYQEDATTRRASSRDD